MYEKMEVYTNINCGNLKMGNVFTHDFIDFFVF